jgi:diguanylate cyclase (GGDEF)-like protein
MGHRIPVHLKISPVHDKSGKVIGVVEVMRDLTRSKATERRVLELEKLAFRDFLTGLPNRYYTEHKVQQALQDRAHFGRNYGLLMIDLDDFKQINDTYGHNAGDLVLKQVAQELTRGLRSADIVGRWGGEEFLLLAADTSPESLAELAERCRALIANAVVEWQGSVLQTSPSVGATLLRKDEDSSTAVDRADKLMYQSKRKGGNTCSIEFETQSLAQNS